MLTLRRRGKIWHVRGTVRVGDRLHRIDERSTGCRERAAAEEVRAKFERDARDELLHGAAGRARRLTFAAAGQLYLAREKPIHPQDLWRIGQLGAVMGEATIDQAGDAWQRFREQRCRGLKAPTVSRYRVIAQAVLHHAAGAWGIAAPRLPSVAGGGDPAGGERVRWLTQAEQERLLAAYSAHSGPIALALCYQGLRSGEALRLDWRHVSLERGTLYVAESKNGRPRTLALHQRVRQALLELRQIRADRLVQQAERRARPIDPAAALARAGEGRVFLNRLGQPYRDARDSLQGGNPLSKTHETACTRAAIEDFRVHDWRHHWASWMVMLGVDLLTLQRLGGWRDIRMVQRYAALSTEHMAEAVAKMR